MMTKSDGFRKTRYEREFETVNKVMDVERFALELEYDEDLGKAIKDGVRAKCDERQAAFDRLMDAHPKTIAERERWELNRQEYERRMERLRREDRVIPADSAARQLARRWGLSMEIGSRNGKAVAATA